MSAAAAHHYRPDVDGLRALAVLAVVAFHAAPLSFPGGFLGVDVFFVISGYLISGLVLAQLRSGTFTMSGFYLRRARRILPALLLMLLVVSLLSLAILLAHEMRDFQHRRAIHNYQLIGATKRLIEVRDDSRRLA